MTTTRWWWVRHAPSAGLPGIIHGQDDVDADLTDLPAIEARIRKLPKGAIWLTSGLPRTVQTAEALGGIKCRAVPGLMEQDFGDWTGKTYEEVRSLFGDAYDKFWITPAKEKPPNGENFIQVIDRVRECILDCTKKFKGRDVICISHGGVIRAALTIALKIEAERALSISVDNLSTTIIDYLHPCETFAGAWRVKCTNVPAIQETY